MAQSLSLPDTIDLLKQRGFIAEKADTAALACYLQQKIDERIRQQYPDDSRDGYELTIPFRRYFNRIDKVRFDFLFRYQHQHRELKPIGIRTQYRHHRHLSIMIRPDQMPTADGLYDKLTAIHIHSHHITPKSLPRLFSSFKLRML